MFVHGVLSFKHVYMFFCLLLLLYRIAHVGFHKLWLHVDDIVSEIGGNCSNLIACAIVELLCCDLLCATEKLRSPWD